MDMNRERLTTEINALSFTATELHLFLNTHPCDMRAICLYNDTVRKLRICKDNYERIYGMLTFFSVNNSPNTWTWIESPWPWENQ